MPVTSLKTSMRSFLPWTVLVLVIGFIIAGCSSSGSGGGNITEKVNQHIKKDRYSEALDLLEGASNQSKADSLREKVHLNYGLFLEYRGGEENMNMRDRMTGALEQFIRVLEINPANQKALAEIKQIMSVYSTMPSNQPPEDIIEKLDKLGIAY